LLIFAGEAPSTASSNSPITLSAVAMSLPAPIPK
jgi:hypothetical protein